MIWPRAALAAILVAAPIWAGAFDRSLLSLASLTPVFAIAYLDGRQRAVRERLMASGAKERFWALIGALVAQAVVVALLFFVAAGAASVLGAARPRAPFEALDAFVAIGVLVASLLGGVLVRRLDRGRDPVDRALEELEAALEPEPQEPEPAQERRADRAAVESDLTILQERWSGGASARREAD